MDLPWGWYNCSSLATKGLHAIIPYWVKVDVSRYQLTFAFAMSD